jgi:hypothetical protein
MNAARVTGLSRCEVDSRVDRSACDDLFHRFDCDNASVEARGDNVRMESHKFDGHTD